MNLKNKAFMKPNRCFLLLMPFLMFMPISMAQVKVPRSDIDQYMMGKAERLKNLNEAKFGMFIHWGPYAVLAGEWNGQRGGRNGEWIMFDLKIPRGDYESMASNFNPVKFNAAEWAKLARDAGMRYMVITAKHCDGFAMYDSRITDYNIADWTPFKRDVCKELKAACNKQDIKLGFYYSHWWDWHEEHAIAGPSGGPYHDNNWDFPDRSKKQSAIYIDGKSLPQVKELVSNYDPYIMWFDVPTGISQEQSFKFLKAVRSQKPDIIINNRIGNDMGDYGTPEQYIPSGISTFEVCMTLNDTWGYKYYDHEWKSAKTIIQNLADIAHKGGNYLLNVGPTAEGIIPPASVRILQEVGKWMGKNGESIYGTTASPLGRLPFKGRCTAKPGKVFVHVFEWPDNRELVIPGILSKIQKVYLLADPGQKPLPFKHQDGDLILEIIATQLPSGAFHEYNTVIAIEYEDELKTEKKPLLVDPSYRTYLTPDMATLTGEKFAYSFHNVWHDLNIRGYHVTNWNELDDTMEWPVRSIRKGRYEVYLKYGATAGCEDNVFEILLGNQVLEGKVQGTGDWYTYESFFAGNVELDRANEFTLTIRPKMLGGCSLMNLKEVSLVPIIK
jgi:alpha-L-fucosidase